MVSASRMGLLDSFGLHWAECASNNWASGPHSHFSLCTLALKMSHCLPHAHRCCGHCAAEAASLVTTTALVAECASNVFITAYFVLLLVKEQEM